ncbi:S8 family serine peptidase [Chitinophagaceae bacterium LWZ2-11]
MKKFYSCAAIFLCFIQIAKAQVITNEKVLQQSSSGFSNEYQSNYQKALVLAKAHDWPLIIKSGKNNSLATLIGVDEFGAPKYYVSYNNTIAAATTRANQLWPGGSSGLALSGSSSFLKNKLAIWDGGMVLTTHVELVGRILFKDQGTGITLSDHSTHVAGTMIATGVNPIAKGMAFQAPNLINYDYNNDIAEIASEAPNLLLSNHSYGILAGWYYDTQNRWIWYGNNGDSVDYKFGYYNTDAQSLDSIAYNAPYYLIVKASGNNRNVNGPAVDSPYYYYKGGTLTLSKRPAGISNNAGYDIISTDANAKNILTIGAVTGLPTGYNQPSDVVMSSFSSWGPTDDGRIKPDLVADGVNVTSCISTSNTAYATYSGTSMATPNTTGSLLLLQEYYAKLKSGAFMRSATLKGLAIHTADEAGPTPGPDYQFGWGLLNVLKASQVITAAVTSNNAATSQHLLYENVLTSGQTYTTTVVASGTGSLKATLSWTDVKGNVDATNILNNRTPKLVNDLDLRITKGSTTYYPWKLDPNNPANAATKGDNILDNVERVDIDSVVPGQTYTITITNKGTLARGTQAYSLLVSGVGGSAYCTSGPTSSAGTRIDSVVIANLNNKNVSGCTTYSDFTTKVVNLEPNKTLPITIGLSSCDASTANKIVKVYIDYNGNGNFTDPGELVATSGVISGTGSFTANITTPNLIIGNSSIMRVVAEETSTASDITPCGSYGKGETQDYKVAFVKPANDLIMNAVTNPADGSCADTSYVTVQIQNNGSVNKGNFVITAVVKLGSTIVANLTAIYPDSLKAGNYGTYTFQTPFVGNAGTAYTITAYVSDFLDQNRSNDTVTSTVNFAVAPMAPTGTAVICSGKASLTVTNPNSSANYFWYPSSTATSPIASGSTASTSTIPSNNTYYLSSGAQGHVGIKSKNDYPSGGGYQVTGGNYMNYTAAVPVVLKSVRLFTRHSGNITITVADIISSNPTTGSYNYQPLNATTFYAYSTNPDPRDTATTGNPAIDTGAVFNINLALPAGSHTLIVTTDSATIFRNNNLTNSPYPFAITNVFSLTGNSATSTTNANYYQGFYYYLYDLKIATSDCISDKIAVVATNPPAPTITLSNDSLVSSASAGNQWYYNNTQVSGATNKSYKPIYSGTYSVIVTDPVSGCQTSASYSYVATAVNNPSNSSISLTVSPNPNHGTFNVAFTVSNQATLQMQLVDMEGRVVYTNNYGNFIGTFNQQVSVGNVATGTYVLKIMHGNNVYHTTMLIQK